MNPHLLVGSFWKVTYVVHYFMFKDLWGWPDLSEVALILVRLSLVLQWKMLMHLSSSKVSGPGYVLYCPKWSCFLLTIVFILLLLLLYNRKVIYEFYKLFSCLILYWGQHSFSNTNDALRLVATISSAS